MNGATFTMKAGDLWRVLGNAAVAASDDRTHPALASVQVTVSEPNSNGEAKVTAAGTDKYMLLVDEGDCIGVTAPITFLLPKTEWARLDKLLKQWCNGGYIVATVEGTDDDHRRIRWDMPDGAAVVTSLLNDHFPKWRSLVPDADATVNLDRPIAFSPKFLARFAKCRVDGTPTLRMTCRSATQAVRLDMGDTLYGVLMPVRLAG